MAIRLSTGLRNMLASGMAEVKGAVIGAGLAFVDGGSGEDSITDSGNGFISAGFAVGDVLFVHGASTPGNSTGCSGKVITSVTEGTIKFETGSVANEEAGGTGTVVAVAKGHSIANIFQGGILRFYTGFQPSNADMNFSGMLLLSLTQNAGSWAAGNYANGLLFEPGTAVGVVRKLSTQNWSGVGVSGAGAAPGTAMGSFRLFANASDAGTSSTTAPRIDGSVAVSGADLNIADPRVIGEATYTMDSFSLTLPMQHGL